MLIDHLSKFLKGILLAIPNIPLLLLWFSDRAPIEKVVGSVIWLMLMLVLGFAIARRRARRYNGGYPH